MLYVAYDLTDHEDRWNERGWLRDERGNREARYPAIRGPRTAARRDRGPSRHLRRELAEAAVRELVEPSDSEFDNVAMRLLDKNRELYERLQ